MRKVLLALCCLSVLCLSSFSQSPGTFDIATFQVPSGWKSQAGQDSLQLSTASNDKYCLVTLFRSMSAIGGPKENFDAAWSTVVVEAAGKLRKPEMLPDDKKDMWDVRSGYAPFEKDGAKGVAMLFVLTGHGKMMIALIMTNSTDYEASITGFLTSVTLKKPPADTTQAAGNNSAIVGQWGISVSPQDSYSVANGINGYTTRQYTFNSNGTYEFLIKLFAYTSSNLLFTKETGTYTISGSTLTITPKAGYIQAWTKAVVTGSDGRPAQTDKWGKLVNTQSWPLERVTYQISKEYMSGIDKWQLRMVSSKPTGRDGPFTGSSAFPNTWFYETMRFPVEPPRQ